MTWEEELEERTQYFLSFCEDNYEDASNAALGEMNQERADRDEWLALEDAD